jgi:predicted nucleotidyltransferase
MLDKTAVREIATRYADEVRKVLNPDAVILFGSYVNGDPHEWSDIDIAVVVNGFKGIGLKRRLCLWTVLGGFESHLLDETCDRSGFVEHVIKTGEVIYSAAQAPNLPSC